MENDSVDHVRILCRQRDPGNSPNTEPDVRDFSVPCCPNVTLFKQANQIACGFNDALRLYFEQTAVPIGVNGSATAYVNKNRRFFSLMIGVVIWVLFPAYRSDPKQMSDTLVHASVAPSYTSQAGTESPTSPS